jgi:hypothetical protein
MSHNKQTASVIALGFMLFLFGCAGQPQLYDGPKLPPEKISVIKGNIGYLPGSTTISITSVDGKQFQKLHYAESVEVLPGTHVLGVYYHWHLAGGWTGEGQVTVETQAGKTYQLNATRTGNGQYVTFSSSEVPPKQ